MHVYLMHGINTNSEQTPNMVDPFANPFDLNEDSP
jgi:hypothetical protein